MSPEPAPKSLPFAPTTPPPPVDGARFAAGDRVVVIATAEPGTVMALLDEHTALVWPDRWGFTPPARGRATPGQALRLERLARAGSE